MGLQRHSQCRAREIVAWTTGAHTVGCAERLPVNRGGEDEELEGYCQQEAASGSAETLTVQRQRWREIVG